MTKICYIIGQLGKGGAERQLYELVKGIDKNKFNPVVISLSKGGYWAKEFRKLNIQIIELHRSGNREFLRLFKIVKLLKAIQPTIVHTYMFSGNSYGRIAAIITRVPIIIASERNLPVIGKDKNYYMICIDKLLAFFSHAIICNSFMASQSLIDVYSFNVEKVFTVQNGIDISAFVKETKSNLQKKLAKKVVGTIGSLSSQKNQILFLDMAKIVIESFNRMDLIFLIVGEGPLRFKLEKYSEDLGISNHVVFTGESDDIPNILKNIDVFVLTSLYEGMANVIMEAMLSGLPIVATDVGGNSELIIEDVTGFLCPSNDAKSLSDKVITLLNDEMKTKSMGQLGKMRILKEFNLERMIRETEDIYIRFLNKKRL